MNFSEALENLKNGKRLTRINWNGKNMFVVMQKGYPDGIPCNEQTAEAWGINEGDNFRCNPYLQIKNSDGSHSMWVPSIGDLFAEDWELCSLTYTEAYNKLKEGKKIRRKLWLKDDNTKNIFLVCNSITSFTDTLMSPQIYNIKDFKFVNSGIELEDKKDDDKLILICMKKQHIYLNALWVGTTEDINAIDWEELE